MMRLLLCLIFIVSCAQVKSIKDSAVAYFKEPERKTPSITQKEIEKSKINQTYEQILKQPIQTEPIKLTKKLSKYCKKIDRYFKKYKWGKSECEKTKWEHVRNSYLGTPLIWTVYGSEKEHEKVPKNTTLIMCGVHGDEITPVKFCFDIIKDLKQPHHKFEDNLVIVAPIVTPDSFFKRRPTRTNARGIDVNRNFPTKDWYKSALKQWRKRYRAQKRRYPGKRPKSEQETIFQVNLIKRYNPNKVISVHSPLTILDYDGPSFRDRNKNDTPAIFANQLLIKMSEKAKGYKVSNYPYFPGSLGNWAGNERNIPTYTLELPSSDWTKNSKILEDVFWCHPSCYQARLSL
jgi:protein MpaA